MPIRRLKNIARFVQLTRPWKRGHSAYLAQQVYHRGRNRRAGHSYDDHLLAAAQWLGRAQDVTGDGGVCGRYHLPRGWSSSYPETTGYILPTFLALAERLGEPEYEQRARQCLEFLLPLQLESGAFPGMEIAQNRTEPSPFNTAQILHGLIAWHRATGDDHVLDAARRAGDWLVSVQDEDGAYRKHYYFDVATTYSAHASCWVAELGAHTKDEKYLRAAERHLDWVLGHVDPETGWVEFCGFDQDDHDARRSVTHTIAYTLWGVLFTSQILGREDGVAVVRRAAEAIARRVELSGRLPGMLDARWKSVADYVCLTGNAQMALIWMRLHRAEPSPRLLNAALKAIDGVCAAQSMTSKNLAIRGGIAGSDPVWGGYIHKAIPNWAAKYFVDALLERERALADLRARPIENGWSVPADVPRSLPADAQTPDASSGADGGAVRIVLYTSPRSKKPAQLLATWADAGLKPDAIVIENPPVAKASQRMRARLREDGLGPIAARIGLGGKTAAAPSPAAPAAAAAPQPLPAELAASLGVPVVEVASLSSPEGIDAVRALAPDIAIHAGAGILRQPLLDLPRLGTLNAHMGLLPFYRGMNVTEWSAFCGDPIGCTAHLVEAGIDTGDILCVREVDATDAKSIEELRARVDAAQLDLLREVVAWIVRHGELPPRRAHAAGDGVQWFRMHADLRDLLLDRLRAGSS